jgi:hypothetical protein
LGGGGGGGDISESGGRGGSFTSRPKGLPMEPDIIDRARWLGLSHVPTLFQSNFDMRTFHATTTFHRDMKTTNFNNSNY